MMDLVETQVVFSSSYHTYSILSCIIKRNSDSYESIQLYLVNYIADQMCDGMVHCSDKSDEDICDQIIIPENYQKNNPPMPYFVNNIYMHYLSLNTSIHILDIIDITQNPGMVTVFMRLQFEWYDDFLTYTFLKDDEYLNPINKTMEQNIWTPNIGYAYLKDQTIDFRSLVIRKLNKPILSGDVNETSPTEKYKGSKNAIKLDIYQTIRFRCHFPNKDQYPFGVDKCSLYIYYQNNDNLLATFNPVQLGTNTFSKY